MYELGLRFALNVKFKSLNCSLLLGFRSLLPQKRLMLAAGTVAMLTCGVGQHLLDSLQGIRPLLFRRIVRQHMVACCCCDTRTPHLYLSAHSVVAENSAKVTLSPYKNRLCHRVHTTLFTSNGICLKFCHFTEDATHTLFMQASW